MAQRDPAPVPATPRSKRFADVVVASLLLLVTAPLSALVGLLVRLRLGRPVVFTQSRPGLRGAPFEMHKFRSMTNAVDADGSLLQDSARLTPLGRALRVSSLDELPELYDVVRGQMSLVGPRPLLHRYTPHLTETERRRLDVPPGITGWAQVNGRNTASWDERLAMDVWYVDNWSWRLDLRILAMTLVRVLVRRGAVADPGSAMKDLDAERLSQHS